MRKAVSVHIAVATSRSDRVTLSHDYIQSETAHARAACLPFRLFSSFKSCLKAKKKSSDRLQMLVMPPNIVLMQD